MRRRVWHGWLVFMPMVVSGVSVGAAEPPASQPGRAVYAQHCARCHGARLEGQADWQRRKDDGKLPAPPHDESGHTWHHPTEQLIRITKCGLRPPLAPEGYMSDMPAYAGVLGDAAIRAVLDFIKSTWPPAIRDRHGRMDEAAGRQERRPACTELDR